VGAPTSAGAREAAAWLAERAGANRQQLGWLGKAARELASRRFDIDVITDRFETVLERAAGRVPVGTFLQTIDLVEEGVA
jgi:hypothetical protein